MGVLNNAWGKSTSKTYLPHATDWEGTKSPILAFFRNLWPCFTEEIEKEVLHPRIFPLNVIAGRTWKQIDFIFPFPLPVKWSVEKPKPRTIAEPMQARKMPS